MLPFTVTACWSTFSSIMELILMWPAMQGRQPFTLAAGEHEFQVYFTIYVFSLLLMSASTDKETSTSCTKWCSTELTCASRTCRGKRPCIMQWLGGTCKWMRNRMAEAAGITFWHRTVWTNEMLLSQCCSALLVGNRHVSLHRHWQVPSDTSPPGCIHWQHRSGAISAEKPGVKFWPTLIGFERS